MRAGRDRDLPVLKALKARRRAHAVGPVAPPSSNARHRRVLIPAGLAPTAEADLAPGPSKACEFAVIADRAGFDALEAEWNALFARAGRPCQIFQTFNWLWHWANHYLDGGTELTVVTGRQDGRLAIVWPLVATRVAGVNQLSWMGEPVSQYGDVLVEEGPDTPDWLRRSWAYVKSLGADIVHLRKVRSDAVISPLLAEETVAAPPPLAPPAGGGLDHLRAAFAWSDGARSRRPRPRAQTGMARAARPLFPRPAGFPPRPVLPGHRARSRAMSRK